MRSGSLIRIDDFHVALAFEMLQTWSQTIQNTHIWWYFGSCMQRRPLTLEKPSRTHQQAKMIGISWFSVEFLSFVKRILSQVCFTAIDSITDLRAGSKGVFSPLLPQTIFRNPNFDFGISIHGCVRFVSFWALFWWNGVCPGCASRLFTQSLI